METDPAAIVATEGRLPRTVRERLLCRAEEWIYDLNARGHWLFSVYEAVNEVWAALVFRGVRRDAARYDDVLEGKDGARVRIRFLTPGDEADFAGLLARFDFAYLPPHPLDRAAAARVLRRRSYLPFGLYDPDGALVGYTLVRLFLPWRAATGTWVLRTPHTRWVARASVKATAEHVTRKPGLADYVTCPLDNVASLRGAQWAGWRIVRTNRHFHVLLHAHSLGEETEASRTSTSSS